MSGYNKEYEDEAKNHKETCFGNYYDEYGSVREEGSEGSCNYSEECRRNCKYY